MVGSNGKLGMKIGAPPVILSVKLDSWKFVNVPRTKCIMRNASYASHRDKFETGDLVNTSYRSCVSTYVENFHYVFIQFLTPYKYGGGEGGRNV